MDKSTLKVNYKVIIFIGIICYSLFCIKQLGDAKGIGFISELSDSWAIIIPLISISIIAIVKLNKEESYIYTCALFGLFIPVMLDDRIVPITYRFMIVLWIAFFVITSILYFLIFKHKRNSKDGFNFCFHLLGYLLLILTITFIGIMVQVFVVGIALPT